MTRFGHYIIHVQPPSPRPPLSQSTSHAAAASLTTPLNLPASSLLSVVRARGVLRYRTLAPLPQYLEGEIGVGPRHEAQQQGMPFAPPLAAPSSLVVRARCAAPLLTRSLRAPARSARQLNASRPQPQQQQRRHRHAGGAAADHYARLGVRRDASPAEIKKSFYALSKAHHPDVNPSDPDAARSFSLFSESYTVLSDLARRAAYDRDVLGQQQQPHHHHRAGSYSSTAASANNPAGGRTPSGLSRRRGPFRGPAPSFYRNGGWGAHAEARRRAHEESTGASSSSRRQDRHAGMGPGSSPFGHADDVPPHFDRGAHTRTHETEDRRRWQRSRRAVGDDDVEFEPQISLAGHFLIVAGILGATFLAPVVYLQFMRLGRRKRQLE